MDTHHMLFLMVRPCSQDLSCEFQWDSEGLHVQKTLKSLFIITQILELMRKSCDASMTRLFVCVCSESYAPYVFFSFFHFSVTCTHVQTHIHTYIKYPSLNYYPWFKITTCPCVVLYVHAYCCLYAYSVWLFSPEVRLKDKMKSHDKREMGSTNKLIKCHSKAKCSAYCWEGGDAGDQLNSTGFSIFFFFMRMGNLRRIF